MQNYIEINKCRVCDNKELIEVIDLKDQPLANSYCNKDDVLDKYPLKLNRCSHCGHLQLSVVVDPKVLFSHYLYVSGTSNTLHKYFEEFVNISEKYTNGKVLDIACNDGTQLDKFKEKGWDTYGVDPAKNLYEKSSKNHNVICGFWNKDVAELLSLNTIFNLIVSQNVFAHVHDVNEFLQACKIVMNKDSYLMIQTSQSEMILNGEFDTIYHEHLSYFHTKSLKHCANNNGFSLVDVFKTDIHGGSYVFVLRLGKYDESKAFSMIQEETEKGLYSISTYDKFKSDSINMSNEFIRKINKYKKDGYKVIGYGAAAKSNTFLNFSGVRLDYIAEDNKLKVDKYTPGMKIIIKSSEVIKNENHKKLIVVALAWNFKKEITKRVIEYLGNNPKDVIIYFEKG
jgi:SAM-dependent methyltransferase